MQPMLNIALRDARSAGELIVRSTDRLDAISVNEKEAKDYVTEIDKAAEQSIVNALRKAYPKQPDGRTLFPFRRIFLTARR